MRRALLAAQLLLLAVGLSACGGGDTLSLDPVAEAATRTAEAGSSRVEFTVTMQVAGENVRMNGSGSFDYTRPRGSLAYRMQVPQLGDVRMELRLLGEKLYLRLPAQAGPQLPAGKEWLGLDLGASLEQLGLGGFDLSQQQDPARTLQLLRAASDGVEERGTAVVRGVETTRYTGTLDFRKALETGLDELGLPPAERQRAQESFETMLEQVDAATLPFEVSIDGDGLVRRMDLDATMAIEGELVRMNVRTDYFDFGVDVDVEAPPAAAVLDVTGEIGP